MRLQQDDKEDGIRWQHFMAYLVGGLSDFNLPAGPPGETRPLPLPLPVRLRIYRVHIEGAIVCRLFYGLNAEKAIREATVTSTWGVLATFKQDAGDRK